MCDDGPSAGVLKQFIPSLIEPGLYLGSIASEQETEVLQSLGVTHVLSLTTGFSPTAPDRFQYEVIGMLDHAGISLFATMDTCLKHIDDGVRSGGVLVHCQAGVSRSAAVVIAHLISKHKWGFDEAFNFVKRKRPVIDPNYGFIEQLKVWAAMVGVMDTSSSAYREWSLKFDDRCQARSMAVFSMTPSEAGEAAAVSLAERARQLLPGLVSWGEARVRPLAFEVFQLDLACVFKDQDISIDDIMAALEGLEMTQTVALTNSNKL